MSIIDKIMKANQSQFLGRDNQQNITINHQGNEKEQDSPSKQPTIMKQDIFIVHGHNNAMKQDVARTLEKIGFHAIILHEQPNLGRTIIEKFEEHANVKYAVVLLSADDMGYSKLQGIDQQKQRARQNVVFEMGFFVGKLGRRKVAVIVETSDNFEKPGDYDGVVYIGYKGDWRTKLGKEMSAVGLDIDWKALASLS